jgi:hypothetical protein
LNNERNHATVNKQGESIQKVQTRQESSELAMRQTNRSRPDREKKESPTEVKPTKITESSVKITEGSSCILDIELHQSTVSQFNLQDDLYFNDSVIIETPMILNFSESIQNSKSLFAPQDKQNRLLKALLMADFLS